MLSSVKFLAPVASLYGPSFKQGLTGVEQKKIRGHLRDLAKKAGKVRGYASKCARSKGVWAIFFGVSPSLARSPQSHWANHGP